MASSSCSKEVTLRSSDGEEFRVEESVAVQSGTIRLAIEGCCADSLVPLPMVSGKTLSMVIDYCKKHASHNGDSELSPVNWDAEFLAADFETLFDVALAANYLDIKSLLDLTCQKVADLIKDLTPEQVRMMFKIENDFTPKEEEELRRQYSWAFD